MYLTTSIEAIKMTEIKVPLQSLEYPPRSELGTLRTVTHPQSIGNSIKMFCETLQGERPLLPNWGLPEIIHNPQVQSDEIEAIILSSLRNYFDIPFDINCYDVGLGQKECKIEYFFDDSSGFIIVQL